MGKKDDAIELSIEETNKIRISLGLAPLQVESEPAKSKDDAAAGTQPAGKIIFHAHKHEHYERVV